MLREYSWLDQLCLKTDKILRTFNRSNSADPSTYPANGVPEAELTATERKHVAGLMRINHSGEVCAQALYQGQGLVSRSNALQAKLQQAAQEEENHLTWCQMRLNELGSRTSWLNPLWYAGSLSIGVMAGIAGDNWSLGFVAETERQVIKHLKKHLDLLPSQDARSAAILAQMEQDEARHRDEAMEQGAYLLPAPIKTIMSFTAKIMVKTAYWV